MRGHQTSSVPHDHRRQGGVMLIELLVTISVIAAMSVAMSALLFAALEGTATKNDLQETFVRLGLLTARVNASIRESTLILDEGDDYLLLWVADANYDGLPNLSELRLIERDTQVRELGRYQIVFDPGLSEEELEEQDTALPLSTNFTTMLSTLRTSPQSVYSLWGENLSSWAIEPDDATVQLAASVSYRLVLEVGQVKETALSSARLRNQ